MRTVQAGQFKAKCLALMDEVQATGQPLIVTKRGKHVVRITPIEHATAEDRISSIFGFMRGKAEIVGDIVGPIIPESEWQILSPDTDIAPPAGKVHDPS